MPPITILENQQITVLYHPDTKIIHHECHENVHGPDFREGLMAGAEAMKKYGAKKWLSDDRKHTVFTPDDLAWTKDVWRPAVLKAGWKYWAIVEPERPLARIRIEERAETMTKLGVTTKLFTDPDEAMKWLKAQ